MFIKVTSLVLYLSSLHKNKTPRKVLCVLQLITLPVFWLLVYWEQALLKRLTFLATGTPSCMKISWSVALARWPEIMPVYLLMMLPECEQIRGLQVC